MSSPSIAICPSPIVLVTIWSELIGDFHEPYGATFGSAMRCSLQISPPKPDGLRLRAFSGYVERYDRRNQHIICHLPTGIARRHFEYNALGSRVIHLHTMSMRIAFLDSWVQNVAEGSGTAAAINGLYSALVARGNHVARLSP